MCSEQDCPGRKPAWACLMCLSTAAANLVWMILLKSLLGMGSSLMPLQLLHSPKSPFLGNLTTSPVFHTSEICSLCHISLGDLCRWPNPLLPVRFLQFGHVLSYLEYAQVSLFLSKGHYQLRLPLGWCCFWNRCLAFCWFYTKPWGFVYWQPPLPHLLVSVQTLSCLTKSFSSLFGPLLSILYSVAHESILREWNSFSVWFLFFYRTASKYDPTKSQTLSRICEDVLLLDCTKASKTCK